MVDVLQFYCTAASINANISQLFGGMFAVAGSGLWPRAQTILTFATVGRDAKWGFLKGTKGLRVLKRNMYTELTLGFFYILNMI